MSLQASAEPETPPSHQLLYSQEYSQRVPADHPYPPSWQAKELALASALRESLVAVTTSPSVDAVLCQILDAIASVIPYEGATLLLFEHGQARVAHARGFPEEALISIKAAFIPATKSHFLELMATKRPYLVKDTTQDPNWMLIPGTEWIRASMGVPIIIQEQVIGLIAVDSREPGRYDENDVARVQLLARVAALAVTNAFQNDRLAELVDARTDQLQQAKQALEEKEALLRSAQHIAHLGSWVYDPVAQYTEWSEEMYRLVGFDPAHGVPSVEAVMTLLPSADAACLVEIVQQIMTLHTPIEAELSFTRASDGALRHAFLRAEVVGAPGATQRLHGIVLDITARKQSEEMLRQALAHEKALSELKSRFVAMASHEFRNPLHLILANVELLRDDWQQQPQQVIDHRLEIIQEQATALNDIIRRLLELLRIQAGVIDFQPGRLELTSLCHDVVTQLQRAAPHLPQVIMIEPAMPIWVWGDPVYLHRIVGNLVGNAQKYTRNGAPVQLAIVRAGARATLHVVDQGIGIAPADLEHLYEPFHRGGNVQNIPGTGLGMALVKQLVDLHRGELHVHSEVGSGTCITLHLPLATDNPAA